MPKKQKQRKNIAIAASVATDCFAISRALPLLPRRRTRTAPPAEFNISNRKSIEHLPNIYRNRTSPSISIEQLSNISHRSIDRQSIEHLPHIYRKSIEEFHLHIQLPFWLSLQPSVPTPTPLPPQHPQLQFHLQFQPPGTSNSNSNSNSSSTSAATKAWPVSNCDNGDRARVGAGCGGAGRTFIEHLSRIYRTVSYTHLTLPTKA